MGRCSYWGDIIINGVKCAHEIMSRIAKTKAGIIKKSQSSKSKLTRLQLNDETAKVVHLKYSFVWCWNKQTAERISDIPGKL